MEQDASTDEIGTALIDFIAKEFHAPSVGWETPLPKNVLNSLGVFSVASFVENRFGVTLDDSELTVENFQTVRALVRLVSRAATDANG